MQVAPSRAFARYAWAFLAYLLFVILYGAWVRITHSGAGCGSHWPLCDGEVVPLAPSHEKVIEYTHRLTSGLSAILGLGLLVWSRRVAPRGHRVRRGAAASFVLLVVEALLGAGLVLFGLVNSDDSATRAVVVALHLANTLMLTGATALTAWWASGGGETSRPVGGGLRLALLVGLGLVVVTSMTGAVTALGDTVFPVGGAHTPADHFLVRLRIVHPLVAVAAGLYLLRLAARVRGRAPGARGWATALFAVVVVQLAAGVLNVALAAPGWMQLVHLLLAQGAWLAAVIMTAAALAGEAAEVRAPAGAVLEASGAAR